MFSFVSSVVRILLVAQANQATITGVVRDATSAEPLVGAVVLLPDLDRAAVTDESGRFLLRDVPAGPQHLTVQFIGYASRSLHALVPRHGQLEINISIRMEPIPLPPVEVRRRVTVRGAERVDSLFPDREMSIAAVRNHPLLAEPDVFQALAGGMVVLSPESPSGVHIRGGAADHTAYLLDGIPIFSPYHAGGVFSAWNPDAVSRLQLSSSAPSPALPDALSGAVSAFTRTPGARFRAEGGVSTTQARATVDGPLAGSAGYLLSLRSGFPGAFAPRDESSYLRGETRDALAKLESPAFGGRIRVLGYDSENELDAARVADVDTLRPDSPRNVFEWRSRSIGAEWLGNVDRFSARLVAWSASAAAHALWSAETGEADLAGARHDRGMLVSLELDAQGRRSVAGLRLQRSRTDYRVESGSRADPTASLETRTPVAAAFFQHTRPLGSRTELDIGASAATAARRVHLSPRAQLRWRASDRIALSGSYARLHQFAQSLRNAESIVGSVFPADIFIGAGAPGVPVARSDQGVIAAEYNPFSGVRFGLQAYVRDFDGLLLVAPRDDEPFTTGSFTTGSGASRGLSFDGAIASARYGIVASYGWQRVLLDYADSSYVPDHGDTHQIDAGAIIFPTATWSIRIGITGALGRRTTSTSALEWEACNLLDEGCEFAGSPRLGAEPLGATRLPAYARVDLGLRKHWHINVRGRDASLALFGTVTNLFARRNVLTYATNGSTGEPVAVEMRPFAPLVVGLDWRF